MTLWHGFRGPQRLLQASPRPLRYALSVICLVALVTYTLHFLDLRAHSDLSDEPDHKTSLNRFIQSVDVRKAQPVDLQTKRANATFVMLCRENEVLGVESSMKSVEEKFNHRHNYPWVFLNEVPFSENFKARVRKRTNGEVTFGVIPHDEWYQPDWINETLAKENRIEMHNVLDVWPIPYALSVSYRNMCRFNSGFFFRHELLAPYKWYWRVEPKVEFTCDIDFDPFVYMIENNKRYSFVITLEEVKVTISSLWDTIRKFRTSYPELAARDNALSFVSDDRGATFNYCHFWSNFEIADLDLFRSPEYLTYFDFLDQTGNFYYERWGDAPVHSIAAALFLPKDQIHYFRDLGYIHSPLQHCPKGETHATKNCACKQEISKGDVKPSCWTRWEKLQKGP